MAFPAYRDIAAMSDVFSGVATFRSAAARWETPDGPLEVAVDFATASYFPVLGLSPARGRWFETTHDTVGAEPAAVVSDKAWRTRFGSDPNIVGRTVRLNNQPVTIIGVGPRTFNGDATAVDFWLSISAVCIGGPFAIANLERRQDHWFGVKARLARGVTAERARNDLKSLAARHGELYPDIDRGRDLSLFRLDEVRSGLRSRAQSARSSALVGLVPAVVAAQGMQALLFGVGPIDPVSLAAAALLLSGGAALAACLPARHAIRANLSDTLRSQ